MYRLLGEYLAKGLFIGLLAFAALIAPSAMTAAAAGLLPLAGAAVGLVAAAWGKGRPGQRIRGRWLAYLVYLVLESPAFVYAGVLAGMTAAAVGSAKGNAIRSLGWAVLGGAALGLVAFAARQIRNRWVRAAIGFALAAALVGAALFCLQAGGEFLGVSLSVGRSAGWVLLAGLPFLYLLNFAGAAEESEAETGVLCAGLGVGLWLLLRDSLNGPQAQWAVFLVPAAVYYAYTQRILPPLRVFKHVVHGLGHAQVGRHRQALQAYRRALQLDPDNGLARESLWALHRQMDWDRVKQDRETLAYVDVDLCLERAEALLLGASPPPERLEEAQHLLDLVAAQRPHTQAVVEYWRSVALTHARRYGEASEHLSGLLDPAAWRLGDPARASVLFRAWQLALVLHPELNRRVGAPQLELPGRRMEAIAATERVLADAPEDGAAWDLKRILYSTVTEGEYEAASGADPGLAFDHGYAQQLGLALLGDPARWQRGAEYLRIAARGLPGRAVAIYEQIAYAHERAGDAEAAGRCYHEARRVGLALGPTSLPEEERRAFFTAVKALAEGARARRDWDGAIENYRLLADSASSGVETLRTLADLYERKGDVPGALRTTEQALLYNARDKDLLDRKDRYYISLEPAVLRRQLDSLRPAFDVEYCLRKARALLDFKHLDLDQLDWAQHLAELVTVVRPESVTARYLVGRALRRRGEGGRALTVLEDIYTKRPASFACGGDEEAWFWTCRQLGEMYLYELGRPDLAVGAFKAFRLSAQSGADTVYKLGQAYEQIGDLGRARKCYENVASYESHPLAPDAREALYRLRSNRPQAESQPPVA